MIKINYDRKKSYNELDRLGKIIRIAEVSVLRFAKFDLGMQATALTYFTVFSIVPMAALIFGISRGFRGDGKLKDYFLSNFGGHQEAINLIFDFAEKALQQANGGLVAGVGIAMLLVTVFMLGDNIDKAFNKVWLLPERRNLLRRFSDFLTVLIVTPVLILIASSGGVMVRGVLQRIFDRMPISGGHHLLDFISYLLPFILSILIFTFIYKKVPNTKVKISSALVGGILGGVLYQFLQLAFIYSQLWLSKYNAIYGSFAALPLLLIFLQLSWKIVFFGAEMSFVHQNIESGRFELYERKYTALQLWKYQVLIVRYIVRSFAGGGKIPTEQDVANGVNLPTFLVRRLLTELLESGLICEAGYEHDGEELFGYHPARDLSNITIMDVTIQMTGKGRETELDPQEPDFAILDKSLEEMSGICAESAWNLKIGAEWELSN